MKSRKSFLNSVISFDDTLSAEINQSNFLSFTERDYVFEILKQLINQYSAIKPLIEDYYRLEQKRYQVFDSFEVNEKKAIDTIAAGIEFCSRSSDDKRRSFFKVNPKVSDYLFTSIYPWEANMTKFETELKTTQYLFIPSYLKIAPKEIFLTDFNAVLSDIMYYEESFSYQDFFELLKDELGVEKKMLDEILLTFLEEQILYYGTLIPV
nr:hypothetical protein [Allomuricauda sp.]